MGVFLVTEYLSILFFSNSKVCVSKFYSFILHFCLIISISLVLCDIFVSFIYDSALSRLKMFEIAVLTTLDIGAFAFIVS